MTKLYQYIIASSALSLILHSGPVLSETPKKKAATAGSAVTTLQNGYTSGDTSAHPQAIIPNDFANIKVDGVGGSSTGTGGSGGTTGDQNAGTSTGTGGSGGTTGDQNAGTSTGTGGSGANSGAQGGGSAGGGSGGSGDVSPS